MSRRSNPRPMSDRSRHLGTRMVAALAFLALVTVGLVATKAPAALADSLPTTPGTPATVSGDPLPTVQIDGVAWAQVVVGTTVLWPARLPLRVRRGPRWG